MRGQSPARDGDGDGDGTPGGAQAGMGPGALGALRLGVTLLVLGPLRLPPVRAPSESKCLAVGRGGGCRVWGGGWGPNLEAQLVGACCLSFPTPGAADPAVRGRARDVLLGWGEGSVEGGSGGLGRSWGAGGDHSAPLGTGLVENRSRAPSTATGRENGGEEVAWGGRGGQLWVLGGQLWVLGGGQLWVLALPATAGDIWAHQADLGSLLPRASVSPSTQGVCWGDVGAMEEGGWSTPMLELC